MRDGMMVIGIVDQQVRDRSAWDGLPKTATKKTVAETRTGMGTAFRRAIESGSSACATPTDDQ